MYRILFLLLTTAIFVNAKDWANWRGPNFDGSAEGKNIPAEFSKTDKVKWQVNLDGIGASTPVITGDYIFVSVASEKRMQLEGVCYDRKTGKELWRVNAGSGYKAKGDGNAIQLGPRSNYASPSPVTDGEKVAFFYGNGDLVCYDNKGKEIWRHNIQKEEGDFSFQWTFSATPTLFKGKLYMPVLQRDEVVHGRGKDGNESYINCYDFNTGKKLWKYLRKSPAKKESLESFTTMIPQTINGKDQLVLAGGDILTGHDPETGKELWSWGTWNKNHREQWWRLVPTVTPGPDNIFVVCAPKKAPVYAIQVQSDNSAKLLWQSEDRGKVTSDVPAPAYYMDHFYVLSDVRKAISKVEPKTGKVLWSTDTPGNSKYRSSPLGVDGKIYIMNHSGDVVVYDAKNGKQLAVNKMGDDKDAYVRASISCVDNNLFIRTERKIYCIGN